MYAITKGFEIIKNAPAGTDSSNVKKYLIGELTECEQMKKGLPEGTTKADHRYVIENFVTSVFTNVDKEERTCETITKKNA